MTLYLYQTGTTLPILTMEQVASYTADSVTCADGVIFGPFAEGCELSSLEDCSEILRADWRTAHPSETTRLEELEALMAELLFGGESV